jgi:hypothetical protein
VAESGKTGDDAIIQQAQDRFRQAEEVESSTRSLQDEDEKFCNADSDNNWQWPTTIYANRSQSQRPCLTVNKVRQHCLQIVNDARQNKPSVKVHPVGFGATAQAAQVFEGIVRHIEYISNAQDAYDSATVHQVERGIGYWRVATDWADDQSLDQEIFIRPIRDAKSVYLDPDIEQADGSDARWAFVFREEPRDVWEKQHPDWKDLPGTSPLHNSGGWSDNDHIRVAEYFRKVEKKDTLYALPTGMVRKSEADELTLAMISAMEDAGVKVPSREVPDIHIEWFLIAGNEIVERQEYPGLYIPIVRLPGEETRIDGKVDYRGHVRNLKDPQRMYNYWTSAATEFVALQSKVPWLTDVRAIEGLETYWSTANTENHAYLPYNGIDDQGQPIPPPVRATPPTMSQAYMAGMETAANEMMMASGQYQAEMGAPGNERSGIAIQQRQRQGDNATYHYIDNLGKAIRFTGKILIDLIPRIYDTPRVLQILAQDGSRTPVQVQPDAPDAHAPGPGAPQPGQPQQPASPAPLDPQIIFNPNIGRYDVEAEIGPAFATRRQEAFNAFTQIAAQNASVMPIIGDLMFKAADFPMADEIAERLARMVPPQALGGPDPHLAQLQQQVASLHNLNGALTQQLAVEKGKQSGKDEEAEIRRYQAETARMSAIGNIYPAAFIPVIRQLIAETMGTSLVPLAHPHDASLGGPPQIPQGQAGPTPAMPMPNPAALHPTVNQVSLNQPPPMPNLTGQGASLIDIPGNNGPGGVIRAGGGQVM